MQNSATNVDEIRRIVYDCRKGKSILVVVENEKTFKYLWKELKSHLSDFRGVLGWKGYVVFDTSNRYAKEFDIVINKIWL